MKWFKALLILLTVVACSMNKKYYMGDGVFSHVEYVTKTGKTYIYLNNSRGRYTLKGHHIISLTSGDEFDLFENIHYQWLGLEKNRTYDIIVKEPTP